MVTSGSPQGRHGKMQSLPAGPYVPHLAQKGTVHCILKWPDDPQCPQTRCIPFQLQVTWWPATFSWVMASRALSLLM